MSISRRLLVKALFSRNPGKVMAAAAMKRHGIRSPSAVFAEVGQDLAGLQVGYKWGRSIVERGDGLLGAAGSGASIWKNPEDNTASLVTVANRLGVTMSELFAFFTENELQALLKAGVASEHQCVTLCREWCASSTDR